MMGETKTGNISIGENVENQYSFLFYGQIVFHYMDISFVSSF